jgi:hypothetical protein
LLGGVVFAGLLEQLHVAVDHGLVVVGQGHALARPNEIPRETPANAEFRQQQRCRSRDSNPDARIMMAKASSQIDSLQAFGHSEGNTFARVLPV